MSSKETRTKQQERVDPSQVSNWPRWKGVNEATEQTYYVFAPNKDIATRKIVTQFLNSDEDWDKDLNLTIEQAD
jgi:hypothetical protein